MQTPYSCHTIRQIVKRSRSPIGHYVEAHDQERLNGLAMTWPRRLTEAQDPQLYDLIVEKTPGGRIFGRNARAGAPIAGTDPARVEAVRFRLPGSSHAVRPQYERT